MRLILLLILLVTAQTIPSDSHIDIDPVREFIICTDRVDSTKRIEVLFDSSTPEYVVTNKVQYKFISHVIKYLLFDWKYLVLSLVWNSWMGSVNCYDFSTE